MTKLASICAQLEKLYPLRYAGKWDNVGLLVEPSIGASNFDVKNVFLTNDLTTKVLEEAISKKSNMIISYHPPMFAKGFLRMRAGNVKESIILKCIEHKIAVYSPHTACDCSQGGVNDWLIKNLVNSKNSDKTFKPASKCDDPNADFDVTGFGRTGNFDEQISLIEIVNRVKKLSGLSQVQVSKSHTLKSIDQLEISSIGVCAGSGGSVLSKAQVDVVVTGEMSHHEILAMVERGVSVILTCHTNTERGYLPVMAEKIGSGLEDGCEFFVSEVDEDPQQLM